MAPTTAAAENPTPAVEEPQGPPEEQFWKRYSKHHELPLSSVTSIALHALIIGAIVALGVWGARLGFGEGDKPVDIAGLLEEGGGGGSPDGSADAKPEEKVTHGAEVAQRNQAETAPTRPPEHKTELNVPTPTPQPKIEFKEKSSDAERLIQESESAVGTLAESSKAAEDLLKNLGPAGGSPAPAGRGGPGSGGGMGSGHGARTGPGTGNGPGDGRGGTLSQRAKRVLRWHMIFRPRGPDDHLHQLAALGAILAFPQPGNRYYVVRDPDARPAHGQIEDVSKLNRIFWMDQEPNVAQELIRVLGLRVMPANYFVVFFPEELEKQMSEMELQYRQKPENEIDIREKFEFDVVPDGRGGYRVIPAAMQH